MRRLCLPSFEHRRSRGDMIDMYKYMHGLYDVDRPHFELATHRDTRGHSLKVNKGHCRLNVRSNFFSQRVVNLWNSLPGTHPEQLQVQARHPLARRSYPVRPLLPPVNRILKY
jgi:hypothetical protein